MIRNNVLNHQLALKMKSVLLVVKQMLLNVEHVLQDIPSMPLKKSVYQIVLKIKKDVLPVVKLLNMNVQLVLIPIF